MAIDIHSHFYDAANFECNRSSWGWKPAASLENEHHISGIASYYKFPATTVDNETTNFSLFFEHHVCSSYSDAVFACYKNLGQNDLRIERIADLDPTLMNRMQEDWKALVALNPELTQVQVDINDPLTLFDALEGVACLFNVDDLNLFLTGRAETKSMDASSYLDKIPGYDTLMGEVRGLLGAGSLGWVASPQTLNRIKEKLQP